MRSLVFSRLDHNVPNGHSRRRHRIIIFVIVIVPLLFYYQTISVDGGAALTRLSSRDGDAVDVKVKRTGGLVWTGADLIEGEHEASHDPADEGSSGAIVDVDAAETNGGEGKKSEVNVVEVKQNHWALQRSSEGNLTCQIHTYPKYSSGAAPVAEEYASGSRKEQYVIHIHGLHHTGTGFLRQTLHDALNREFSTGDDSPPVASTHDSLRPYRHQLEEAREEGNKTKYMAIFKEHRVMQDEGQLLQTVYPRFLFRTKLLKNPKANIYLASLMPRLTSLCTIFNDDGGGPSHRNDRRIGIILLEQWMRYWDRSATFLIQKTPTVDVLFLERVKVLPTLHVIIVRHPMTRNPWNIPGMSFAWPNVWASVFESLRQGKVDWYAVVTYEALISNHGEVVRELMEVVRSGMMRRYDRGGRKLKTAAASDAWSHRTGKDESPSPQPKLRRRLHLRERGVFNETYLVPQEKSVRVWEKCLNATNCYNTLEQLTRDVFPFFGFVNVHQQNGVPLRSSPGTVTAMKEFGRVLFTSEGDALNKLRQSHGNYQPPLELISKMKEFSIK